MHTITITIEPDSEGDLIYRVWPCSLESAYEKQEAGDSEGNDNGGLCTATLTDALGMAEEAAISLIREANADNVNNPDLCPGALNENGEIDVDDAAHKWDGKTCSECGAEKDEDDGHADRENA